MSLLSVISVVKDDFYGLVKTRDSLMPVDGIDLEWIVVDGTPFQEAAEQVCGVCPFPVKVISEEDKGPYDAMNKGLKLAQGDWILFLNAGDQLLWSDIIPFVLAENSDVGILYGNTVYQYKKHVKRKIAPTELSYSYGMPFCHQAAWYSGSLKSELSYNLNYKLSADFEMLLRVVNKGAKLKKMEIDICNVDPYGLSNRQQFQVTHESFRIAGAYGMVGIGQAFWFFWRFIVTFLADRYPRR